MNMKKPSIVRKNLMALSSCRHMHDHGHLEISWRYAPKIHPLAVSIRPRTPDDFVWLLPLEELVDVITDGMKTGVVYTAGIASIWRRRSMPSAIVFKLPTPESPEFAEIDIPPYLYFILSLANVRDFLDSARKISCDVDIDNLISQLLP